MLAAERLLTPTTGQTTYILWSPVLETVDSSKLVTSQLLVALLVDLHFQLTPMRREVEITLVVQIFEWTGVLKCHSDVFAVIAVKL